MVKFDQAFRYCKPQSGTAVIFIGMLRFLFKRIKYYGQVFGGNTYYTTPQKAMRNNFCKQFLTDVPIKIGIINKIPMKQNTCPNNNFTIVSYLTGH